MNCKDTRKTKIVLDIADRVEPQDALSPYGVKSKWRVVPYTSEVGEGKMLSAIGGNPADITYNPGLNGWYKVYIYFIGSSSLNIKLSGDKAFMRVNSAYGGQFTLERLLWKCADMTDQSIVLTKKMDFENVQTYINGFEFVPMTEEEVAEYKYEETRTDTKRIYATDDMHNRLYCYKFNDYSDWLGAVENYVHSDVEWVSVEQIRHFVSKRLPCEDPDDFGFFRLGDRNVQRQFPMVDYDKVLHDVVEYGHEKGMKMSVSFRMGAWGMTFPYDQYYFDCDFMQENPQWRTFDRNGDEIAAMSYAYPEVQDYVVSELVNMARSGCDAVALIAHRGIPYVLFEKPVADRFFELYGEYPYELPLDEPRLNKLHCDIMIEFFRKARAALDAEFGKDKVKIHLRSMFSKYDTKVIALDTDRLAEEGLIDTIISYPQRHYEKLDGDIWQEGKEYRIDLEKYTKEIERRSHGLTYHTGDVDFEKPYTNYRGELCGPETQKARVEEWMELEKKYGVKIYIDILPRSMPQAEFKRRALELYECGAERFCLWDTFGRAPNRAMWAAAGRIGHKEELADMSFAEDSKWFRVRKLGSSDVSRYHPNWGG
ncbi:MAG: hypothetical protein J6Q78_05480 [Clostridia bacterium]|nr:hypothetical protein [Clostridia bacterium]